MPCRPSILYLLSSILCLTLVIVLWLTPAVPSRGGTIRVSAAISLKDALTEIAAEYQKETGEQVRLNFSASGHLMAQIKAGAPTDLFISAAPEQVDELIAANLADGKSRRVIAANALVLIAPADAAAPPKGLADLADPRHKRIAIGDPRTVPAGQYAMQMLTALKLTDALKGRLIHAASVRQVLDYVERGEVSAGLVYSTDALLSGGKVKVIARAEASTHDPIIYPAVLVSSEKRQPAKRFLAYLTSEDAQRIFEQKGFAPPPGTKTDPATRPAVR
jgi:molybdate transport system substrate-binding protein